MYTHLVTRCVKPLVHTVVTVEVGQIEKSGCLESRGQNLEQTMTDPRKGERFLDRKWLSDFLCDSNLMRFESDDQVAPKSVL